MPWSDPGIAGWVAFHLVCAALGTWWVRRYALHRRLLDEPGDRRSHAVPTPRGGGAAIAILVTGAALWLARHNGPWAPALVAFAGGLSMVAMVGWWDDHRPLSAWFRLAVHALASALLAGGFWWASGDAWIALAAFVAPLVLTNLWNFMDGIDGLAASQAALVAVALAILGMPAWTFLALALLAACCGFLPFNFPRARIFLGDVGSGSLGYALGTLFAATLHVDMHAGMLALFPLSAFLLDAGLTLAWRMGRGEQWWTPHVGHAYQILSRRFGSHVPVTGLYALWTVAGLLLSFIFDDMSFTSLIIPLLTWYASGAGLWWLAQQGEMSRVVENKE